MERKHLDLGHERFPVYANPLFEAWVPLDVSEFPRVEEQTHTYDGNSGTSQDSEQIFRETSSSPNIFDPGECRDWMILELGENEQIPSILRYEVGIQEVRDRVSSRYGVGDTEQAMEIMFDLILNKRNATGFGVDDGDLWAPW